MFLVPCVLFLIVWKFIVFETSANLKRNVSVVNDIVSLLNVFLVGCGPSLWPLGTSYVQMMSFSLTFFGRTVL